MRLWTIRIANAARISTKKCGKNVGLLFPNYSPSRDCFTYTRMRLSGPGVLIFASRVISANQRSALRSSCIRSRQYAETTCCCCLKREKKNARGFYRGQLFPERNTSANTRRANRTREDLECKYGLWRGTFTGEEQSRQFNWCSRPDA